MELTGVSTIYSYQQVARLINISVTDLQWTVYIDATPAVKYMDIIVVGPSSNTARISVHYSSHSNVN